MFDATLVSSILVPICGLLGTVLAAKIAGDKRESEQSASAARTTADELRIERARNDVLYEYVATLRRQMISEGYDPPPLPDVLKRLK